MKAIGKILVILGLMFVYWFLINYIYDTNFGITYITEKVNKSDKLGVIEVNVGESVSVSVERASKWYGKGYWNEGKEIFYLFYFIKLPVRKNDFSYIYIHLVFSIFIAFLIVMMFIVPIIKNLNKSGGKNEEMAENSSEDTFDNIDWDRGFRDKW